MENDNVQCLPQNITVGHICTAFKAYDNTVPPLVWGKTNKS